MTTGRRTAIWDVPMPKRSIPATALARTLNTVRLSGRSTSTVTVPDGPTARLGS